MLWRHLLAWVLIPYIKVNDTPPNEITPKVGASFSNGILVMESTCSPLLEWSLARTNKEWSTFEDGGRTSPDYRGLSLRRTILSV